MNFKDVDFKTFVGELENKKIICIGAGKILNDMFFLWDEEVISRVEYVLDNNKTGDYLAPNNKIITINRVNILDQMDLDRYVILVTSMYCRSLLEQIQEILGDKNVNCYLYPIMSMKTDFFDVKRTNERQLIPKKIHYFWFGKGQMPEENEKCIESWKKYCPDYEIIKWTEDNYDITKCRYMQQAYESRRWGFVPDYARLDIVYQYGGIYLDTDVELVRNLDELLYQDAFAGFQRDFWVALGLGFGSRPGNAIIKEMRDEYDKEEFIVEGGKLNLTASPYYQTKVLMRHGLKCNNQFQHVDGITIFPTEVLDPQGYSYGKIKLTDKSYSIHHYSESWVDTKQREENIKKYMELDYFR